MNDEAVTPVIVAGAPLMNDESVTPVIVAVVCVRPPGPVDQPKTSILQWVFAYFELLLVVVFVGLLVGVGGLLGACWGAVGGLLGACWGVRGGWLKGGSSQQMRFRGKGVEYDGLSCGCNRKITAS